MRIGSVTLATLVLSCAAFGHHSFDAEFDGEKNVSVDGIVTKVEWINPHSYIYIDVTGKDGKVTNYAVEGGPVGMLRRWGIEKDYVEARRQNTRKRLRVERWIEPHGGEGICAAGWN